MALKINSTIDSNAENSFEMNG